MTDVFILHYSWQKYLEVLRMRNLLLEKERPGKEERDDPKDLELHLTNVIMWVWLKCEMDRERG